MHVVHHHNRRRSDLCGLNTLSEASARPYRWDWAGEGRDGPTPFNLPSAQKICAVQQ